VFLFELSVDLVDACSNKDINLDYWSPYVSNCLICFLPGPSVSRRTQNSVVVGFGVAHGRSVLEFGIVKGFPSSRPRAAVDFPSWQTTLSMLLSMRTKFQLACLAFVPRAQKHARVASPHSAFQT
jgi:hypothetical protein